MKFGMIVASLLATSLLTTVAYAQELELNEAGKLNICVIDATAPMASVNDGELEGYEISFSRAIAERLGLEPQYRTVVFEGVFAAVANHLCDISAGSHSITLKRQEIVDFSRPHFVGSYTIVTKDGSGITDETGLAGKRLGVVAATIQETYANETYTDSSVVPFPDAAALQISLQSGQVDAAFFDGGLAAIYVKSSPTPLSVVVSIPNTDQPAGIGLAKDRPNLGKAVDEAVGEIIADGTYATIYKQWIGETVPTLPGPDFVPKR